MADTNIQTHEHDVLVIGAGGAGLRAAIEASAAGASVGLVCKSLLGKAHTVMAEGGMAAAMAQRRRPRQLEGPLRRHHARRPVPQQLAHGRAARQGGARPRARAGGLGRGLRPHQGRPHPAAQLRRPPLPAPRPRRRSHRPGDDPHAAGPRHPPGHQGLHGAHRSPSCFKDGERVAGALGYDRERGLPARVQGARRSCWRPAASAAPTRSPATAGSTPATGTRWPTTRAPS